MENTKLGTQAFKRREAAVKKVHGRKQAKLHTRESHALHCRCGKYGHSLNDCWFKDAESHAVARRVTLHPLAGVSPKAQHKNVARHSKPKCQGMNLIKQDDNTESEGKSFHFF